MPQIGFIGLGVMGMPMALNLARGANQIALHSRTRPTLDNFEGVALWCDCAADLARTSDVVFMMLPDTPDVETVLFAPGTGLAAGLKPGTLVVDMSSISPASTREFARRVRERGCDYLDAPVSGGELGAKAATLTIMAGGRQDAFERALPYFRLMGKNISHVGESGAGQVCKIANQIIVALTIEAVGEALLFASRSGADPELIRKALMGGFAASRVLEVHGERMTTRTFTPGFRIKLHQKDLALALEGARQMGISLPNTANTAQLLQACDAHGLGQLDHSAMCRALELMAAHDIA